MTPAISISSRRVARILGAVVVLLLFAHTATLVSRHHFVDPYVFGFVPLFSFENEVSIPTWFSSAVLLFSSVLLALITVAKTAARDRHAAHWAALSLIFLCLSVDEAAMIHEKAIDPLRHVLDTAGFLYYAWVIPGAAFVLIVFVAYLKFLSALPRRTTGLLLTAGALYVGGALGMELAGGRHEQLYGAENLAYDVIATVEELLEMIGLVVFVYALLAYMSVHVKVVRLRFGPDEQSVGGSSPPVHHGRLQ